MTLRIPLLRPVNAAQGRVNDPLSTPLPVSNRHAHYHPPTRQRAYVHTRGINSAERERGREDHVVADKAVRRKGKARIDADELRVRRDTKAHLVGRLKEIGTYYSAQIAGKMAVCGSYFTTMTCGVHTATRYPKFRCEHRLCPHCAARLSKDRFRKYAPMVIAYLKHSPVPVTPMHLTLTVVHREGETVKQGKKRLYEAFVRLKRRSFWNEHFTGGAYEIESVKGRDGLWHVHLHSLVFRRRFFGITSESNPLGEEWREVTGDSHVVRLDLITDVVEGCREVFKYITKPADVAGFSTDDVRQLLELKGERMFGTFGDFHTFCRTYEPTEAEIDAVCERETFAEGDPCPECGDPLFAITVAVDELIAAYERMASVQTAIRGKPS